MAAYGELSMATVSASRPGDELAVPPDYGEQLRLSHSQSGNAEAPAPLISQALALLSCRAGHLVASVDRPPMRGRHGPPAVRFDGFDT